MAWWPGRVHLIFGPTFAEPDPEAEGSSPFLSGVAGVCVIFGTEGPAAGVGVGGLLFLSGTWSRLFPRISCLGPEF